MPAFGELRRNEIKTQQIYEIAREMLDRGLSRKKHNPFKAPLSPEAAAFLRKRRQLRRLKGNALVFCQKDGKRYIRRRADVAPKRCCRKAGLREISWKVLRHTFASHLAMRGCPLPTLKNLLGHKDIKSTMIYAHLMPETLSDAVLVLDDPPPNSRQHSGNRQEKNG